MRRFTKLSLFGLAVGFGLSLSGCASSVFDLHESAAAQALYRRDASLVIKLSGNYALAALPAQAGRILEVDEERFDNGVSQQIVLAGGTHSYGDNSIDISVEVQPQGSVIRNHLITMARTDDVEIANELQSRFPGVNMKIVPVLLQNHFGPYGMAAGIAQNGDRCIFAWQWVDDFGHANTDHATSLVRGIVSPRQPVSLRIQLCQRGLSTDQLAGLVNDLTLAGGDGGGIPVLSHPDLGVGSGLSARSLPPGGDPFIGEFSGYKLPRESAHVARNPSAWQRRRVQIARGKVFRLQKWRARTAPPRPAQQNAQYVAIPNQPSAGQPIQPANATQMVAPPSAKLDLPPEAYAGPIGPEPRPQGVQGSIAAAPQAPALDASQLLRLHTLQGPSI